MAERKEPTWEPIDLPTGQQPLPAWVKGMHIQWSEQYSNPPSFAIKVTEDTWENKVWFRRNGLFCALHEDGRGDFLSHNGAISLTTLQRRVSGGPRQGEDGKWILEPLVMEDYEVLATTQQDGFGGRHVHIKMCIPDPLAGKDVILRGPWFGGRLPGYHQITTVKVPETNTHSAKRPWYQRGGCFGLFITEDLLLRIFARYQPHLRLVRCHYNWGTTLEPLKPEWHQPKHWIREEEYQAILAKRAQEKAA